MKVKKIPLRKCIVCQGMFPKKELIRVVRTPQEEILIDLTGRAAGRGTYVCRQETCMKPDTFASGKWKKVLERSLNMTISQEQYEAFRNRWLETIGQ
ncbi:MAG TPA: YlxR family protein [Candidatus Bathyarchaeia archaeon]|uniref:RNase P modulator RnpM n=1 Tax=Brevibacillus migulae TaxID=1644114 RepID=UPI00106DE765|nr:YlxR family protein [Brevibacillus migulae]HZG15123.1 YlxR family protein [Candidatus Bathyarchaeia archaeon]